MHNVESDDQDIRRVDDSRQSTYKILVTAIKEERRAGSAVRAWLRWERDQVGWA